LLPKGANQDHFEVRGVPGGADDVEGTFVQDFEIEIPFTGARGHNDSERPTSGIAKMDKIMIGTIGEMLVAKDQHKVLSRKQFLSLSACGSR
jgi:hypothetical protein